ncbi:MAG: glycoside hydrolase family 65 protein, partial [Microbacteriaceae bacterium]|nr:glycoside hydrolase family 65 protein [Microbacteriaceae bacterium]
MAALDPDHYPVDPWRLVEARFEPAAAALGETLFAIGNGYLGMRANSSDGRDAHEHGTFINGLHETWPIRHAEHAYGFAEVGQTIVNAPDAKVIRLYVDDEPFDPGTAEFLEFEHSLDFRTGISRRAVVWRTPGGKRVRVVGTRMVSFVERHLAIITFEVELLDDAAPVTLSSQILNRQDAGDAGAGAPGTVDPRKAERLRERVLVPDGRWQEDGFSALGYRVANSGMTVAAMAHHTIETSDPIETEHSIGPDLAKDVFHIQAQPRSVIRLTKLVSYHTGSRAPVRELVDRCRRTIERAMHAGVDAEERRQREWLAAFWERSDVRVEHDDRLQQAIRWNLLQLAQASARADGLGIAAKGVTGSGYSGHYFWDGEIYALPFLVFTDPDAARNALRMRVRMLPAARRRARMLNEDGALFPWRSINGEEASAYYAAGTAQYHINADITYTIAKYVRATGDLQFLASGGIDVAVETARLWATLGFWRSSEAGDSFHIHGVTGPDEYTTVVNDNLFTNVMARFNLRYAARALDQLEREQPSDFALAVERLGIAPAEPEEWLRIADAIAIPYSEQLGVHPQDSHFLEREVWDLANTPEDRHPLLLHYHPLVIYRFQVLKQADVVLALLLQGQHFTAEQKRADFDYYDPLTTGDSTLSAVVQAIVAAEIGYQDLALEYLRNAVYVDLEDRHGNTADGVHVASVGGVWMALVN